MFLPKNTTSIIQPLDQRVIIATERLYRKRILGQSTSEFLRNYILISSILNFAAAWKAIKCQTLENGSGIKRTFK
jgi:hypothetical protein